MSQVVQAHVFIDANVADVQHLLDGVRPGYQSHVLSPDHDGVEQITAVLQTTPAREVHIISHGAPGSLFLGNSALTLDTLERYSQSLQTWFHPSTHPPIHPSTLYIYGCNVAAGDAGAEFLAKLHNLTGAAIAASTSRVGNAELGGSWYLDVAIGAVNQPAALVAHTQKSYSGVFVDLTQSGSTAIPDGNSSGVEIYFEVTGQDAQAVVSDVTLALKIAHIQRGDLQVELESPDGTVIQLIAVQSTDGFDNYDLLLTDDPASSGLTTTSIHDGNNDTLADPIDRDAAPVESFAAFDGKAVNGTWTLRIKDLNGNNVSGTFQQATLSLATEVITNEAPVFDAVSDPVPFSENSTADVITVTVTDADTDAIQFLTLEGEDAAGFTLTDNGDGTATITPNAAIDLEGGASSDGDDIYEVLVKATDGKVLNPTEQLINIEIQNANDQPSGSLPITSGGVGFQAGDTLTADTASLIDQDGLGTATFSYDWQTSADGLTGWTTLNAPDQSTYALTSGDVDNYLRVVVSYTDDGGFSNTFESGATQQITGIPNDAPVFDAVAPDDFVENSTDIAVTVNATDSDTPVVYSLDDAVGDNALFDVDPSTGVVTFEAAPDFENPLDANQDNSYEIQVKATDDLGASSTQDITIAVIDGNDTPVNQGSILNTTVTTLEDTDYVFSSANGNAITVDDPDVGEILRVVISVPQGLGTIALGNTSGITVINNNTNVVTITGATQEQVNAALEGLTFTPPGDFTGNITLTINTADTEQLSDTDTITFAIENVNDPANISGELSGTIVEGSIESATGVVTVTETGSDIIAGDLQTIVSPSTTVTGDYGTFSIANGTWTYNYTGELRAGDSKTDTFTLTADDGTTETVTIDITGTNDDPVITGSTNVSGLVEDNTSFATGNLTITDADGEVEEAFNVISDQSGTYGFFSISATGTWTYILDNSREVTQALARTETVQDIFTIETADGTTQDFTVNIQGTNDAPVISGSFGGTVKEETTLSTTGSLTVEDIDNGESFFNPIVSTDPAATGTYGTFTIDANGNWDYILDNPAAIDPLSEGEQVFDRFTVSTIDGSSRTVTIAVQGTNDNATIFLDTGDSKAETITENQTATVTGALSITDADDGEAAFQAIVLKDTAAQGTYGTFTIDTSGNWAYTLTEPLDSLPSGQSEVDSFTVTSKDGSTTETVTITIDGLNDPAQINSTGAGETKTGEVTEDVKVTATGKLSVTDVDAGEATFQAVTGGTTANGYGTFDIDASGNWTYNLDNTLTAVQELGSKGTLTDTFVVTSEDGGTDETVTVTIRGTNDNPEVSQGITATYNEDQAGTFQVDLLQGATDIDSANLAIANLSPSSAVDGIQVVGNTLQVTPSAYNSLQEGEPATITYTYDIIDGAGGSVAQTATITINGINDAPVVTPEGNSNSVNVTEIGNTGLGRYSTGLAFTDGILYATNSTGTFTINPVDGTAALINAFGGVALAPGTSNTFLFGSNYTDVDNIPVNGDLATTFAAVSTVEGLALDPSTNTLYVYENASFSSYNATDGSFIANLSYTPSSEVEGIAYAPGGNAGFIYGVSDDSTLEVYDIDTDSWSTVGDTGIDFDESGLAYDAASDSLYALSESGILYLVDTTATGGSLVETATEDDGAFSVDLTRIATDPDTGDVLQATFVNPVPGTDDRGVTINGSSLEVDPSAYNFLGEGDQEVIEYTYRITDGTATVADLTASITITGVNDAPDIGGDVTGEVTESNNPLDMVLTTSGDLTITDADTGEAVFVGDTLTGTYGSLTINTDGTWNYLVPNDGTINALGADDTLTDSFTVTSADGTTQSIEITINGVDDVGTLSDPSQLSAAIAEDTFANTLIVSKQLTLNDPDTGEGSFKAETKQGQYGTLTIDSTGRWEYSASNTQIAVQELSGPLGGNPAEELVENFQIQSDDGNVFDIDVTITGVDDAPTFSGDKTGAVTEDTDVDANDFLVTSGALTVTDKDSDESQFVVDPIDGFATYIGTYGTLTIDANGAWEYKADNTQQVIQDLAANATVKDEFTAVESIDGSTETITITINGTSGPATISGATTGSVTEDLNPTNGFLETTGVINVSDEDAGESAFSPTVTPVEGARGTLTIGATDPSTGNATWTYQVDNTQVQDLDVDDDPTYTESFTVSTADGTEETIIITISGTEDKPTFSGDLADQVTEDAVDANGNLVANGTLTAEDADAGESLFAVDPITGVAEYQGTYGTLTIDANGAWEYVADNTQTAIQELDAAATPLVDSFDAIATVDGTTLSTADTPTSLEIQIKGVDDAATISSDGKGETKTGAIGEDDTTAVQGKMTVTDDDAGDSLFQVVTNQAGDNPEGYGTFSMDDQGNWSYNLSNSQATDPVQSLAAGETATDTYTFISADGSASETVEVTITGVNDDATISSTDTGETKAGNVSEDGTLQASGLLSVDDVDAGEDEFQPIASTDAAAEGTYGTFTIDAAGNWTYDLDNSQVQSLTSIDTPTDTFTVISKDGTATETVTINITGADDIPTFSGDSTGEVIEDTALTTINSVDYLTASGQLIATDADANQSGFKATTTPLTGNIGGELTIDAQGNWDYKIDTSLSTIQALSENSPSLTEEFIVESIDGTTTAINITIRGADDEAQIVGNPDQSAFSGLVVEDDPANVVATGDLNVIDVDSADQAFNVIDQQAGRYGTFSIDAAGTWIYELDNTLTATNRLTENDVKTEKFTVSIPDGTQKTVSITVVGANDAPTGVLTGTLNISGTEDVDINNIPRTTFTSGITDAEGDPLTVQQDGATPFINPTQGELVDNGNGTFSFKPADNYNGEVTVSYVVSDGITTSGLITKTFNVAAVNDAPTTLTGPTGTLVDIDEDTPNVFSVSDLTAGFTDVDGDTLSVSNLRANGSTATIVNNNGIITYTPPENFSGSVEITYSVIDGKGGAVPGQSLSFNVDEVNDLPTGTPEGVISGTEEDTAFDIQLTTLLAGFSDVDEDTLTITSIFVDVGEISSVGDGFGPFTYTPPEDFSGPVEVTYSISDARGGTISNQKLTFNVVPVNDTPVFVGPEGAIADGLEDQPLIIQASTLLQGFQDADNDQLSVQSLVPSMGNETNIVDNGDGTFTYNPPENANGEVTLTYTVTDNAGGSITDVTRTFTLGSVNDAPEGTSEYVIEPLDENTSLTILKSDLLQGFSDPDQPEGDVLSVTKATVSSGTGTLVATTDGYTFTPTQGYNGDVTLTYSVTDGEVSKPGSITFEVQPINDLPGGSVVITNEVKQGVELAINTTGLTDQDGLTQVTFDSYQWQIAPVGTPIDSELWTNIPAESGGIGATYIPTNEQVGASLRVIINYTDDGGFSNTVISEPTGAIANVNDQPSGSPTGTIPANTEDALPFVIASATLLEGFTDPDGNETLSVLATDISVDHGTIVAEGGDFKYTPEENYFGDVTITYTVTDDGGLTIPGQTRTFSLTPVNDAPMVTTETIEITTGEDDAAFTVDLLAAAGASDIEGSPLTVDLTFAEPIPGITLAGSKLNIDPAAYDGLARGAVETITLNYNIVDSEGATTAQTANILINGANDAPEGAATADILPSLQDTQKLIAPSVLLQGFTDPDGDTLSIENVTTEQGTVTIGENGNFVFQPLEGYVGSVTLTYDVTDGAASITGTQTFEMKSNQVPPNVFNFRQYVQYNAIDEGRTYTGPSLDLEIGRVNLAAIFDETYYLSQYSDVAAGVRTGAQSSGFAHFVNYGLAEGRNPSLYYNEAFYLQNNADVRRAVEAGEHSSGLAHYLQYGHLENRVASTFFNAGDYVLRNSDVADGIASGNVSSGFEHFVEYGAAEGRQQGLLFVEQYYLNQNPDVAEAVRNGIHASGYEHYIRYGQFENSRNPGPLFDESDYLGSNPDVAQAVEDGIQSSGFEHFFRYGRAEGRPQFTPENFDNLA